MPSRIFIESFDCVTGAGFGSDQLWAALTAGSSCFETLDTTSWPRHIQTYWSEQLHRPIASKIDLPKATDLEGLSDLLARVARTCLGDRRPSKIGVILATTKGAIEDFVWQDDFNRLAVDPLELVLARTLEKLPAQSWELTQVVSNSCASSHGALALAKRWLETDSCDEVLVLAGDLVGPFIQTGFQSLKALSSQGCKPFHEERDGLVLGDAAAAILLTRRAAGFELVDVQITNEAFTVTGPTPEGLGLQLCLKAMKHQRRPDLAIAHGTGTGLNDLTEDHALRVAQTHYETDFAITGTKWCIGHTLAASGALDLIAALMCLKHQRVYALPGSEARGKWQAKNFVTGGARALDNLHTVLVTSLGFGGTNGALLVQKSEAR